MYAHTQIFHPGDHDRSMVHATRGQRSHLSGREARLHFHYALGFATLKLAYMLDSLVRVSRRARVSHFVRIQSALGQAPPCGAR